MKKKIVSTLIIMSMVLSSISVYAQNTFDNTNKTTNLEVINNVDKNNNSNLLDAEIKGICLSVTPNGTMTRTMNGLTSTMNYNTQYGCTVTFLKLLNWNGTFAALIYDNITCDKKVIISGLGFVWQEATYDYFAETDIKCMSRRKLYLLGQ